MKKLSGMALVAVMVAMSVWAEDKPAAPTTAPSAKRTPEQVMADISAAGKEIGTVITSPDVITNAAKRAEAAPKILPSLQKLDKLTEELAGSDDEQGKM